MKLVRSVAVLAICGLGAGACSINTATYGTGESVELGLARDLAGLATFGALGREKQKPISYRERPPLVLPSKEQRANIPEPITKVDAVDDNFPGRQQELARIERVEASKNREPIANSLLGTNRAQPLHLTKGNDIERKGEVDEQVNAAVGSTVPLGPRELAKSPETIAKERGVTVEELPESLQGDLIRNRSLLERAGLVERKRVRRGAPALTEVPTEYRTVNTSQADPEVEQLLSGKKKKKKKRFIFF